jgi:asparagine synthase (glutamine-hydrolysing)
MSAIAGWVAATPNAPEEGTLAAMLQAVAHRGVEDLCGYVDRRAGRQAVLGASLCDQAARIALVLDGKIDNRRELRVQLAKRDYRFETDSDTEVLLRAYQQWDRDVVRQLHGQFAFAIWDGRKERLLLARDRFGEKPLYLHEKNGSLCFASEPKALLKLPGFKTEVDLQALDDYLESRRVPGPRTLFKDIRKLPPGAYAMWQFGRLRESRYWIAPDSNPASGKSDADAVRNLVFHLEDAVKLRPAAGIFLSGGLDSGVIAALACRGATVMPKTFSLGFEGERASELPHAAQLAKHFGTAHHEVVVSPRELACALPKLVAFRDAPVSGPSEIAVHRLALEAAASGVQSVLTGDGCDEVLGGYRRYVAHAHPWLRWVVKANGCAALGEDPAVNPGTSRLRRTLYCDQTGSLPDSLLERNERLATAAAIEARMPFLDHRLAEYVSALPDELRVRRFTTKWILRQAGRELLPPALRRRPKAGWRVPLADWLRKELRDFTIDHLQGGSCRTRRYHNGVAVDRLLDEHLKGKKNHGTLLWTLLNLEIWHRTYAPA